MNNRIKVSHEVPPVLLSLSKHFNDYDYMLPHLMDENEAYRDYFQLAKHNGRYIVMDNSLHELGHAYRTDRLLHWINELKPDEFIVPDVWEDDYESIRNAREWANIKLPEGVTKVAVVQAKTIFEAGECYKAYKQLGYEKIAFSYGASYYNDICPHVNTYLGKALGRVQLLTTLFHTGIIQDTDRVHLLGCAVPQEFGFYNGFNFVESIDTSNPVMAGLEGTIYGEYGLFKKPKLAIDETMEFTKDDIGGSLIDKVFYNTKKFKTINNL